jgi:hypothetical protein
MKKVTWIDQDDNILFNENQNPWELPRTGETVIWHKHYMEITNIEHNFDENKVTVFVEFK